MKSKNLTLIIIVAIILVAILIILVYNQKNEFDESKAVNIGINNDINYLDECLSVKNIPMENRSQLMRDCPATIDEDNLNKLRLIKDITGIFVDQKPANCNIMYSFDYTEIVVTQQYNSIDLYQCGNKQYISVSHTPPPTEKIYQVKINKDILNQLQQN